MPLPSFSPPRRVPHGVTLIGRLFDEGTLASAGLALERSFGVAVSDRLGSDAIVYFCGVGAVSRSTNIL